MADLTPLKAIRAKCVDCSGGSRSEVRDCTIVSCPLYVYRHGTNPKRKGIGNRNPDKTALTQKTLAEFGVLSEKGASREGVRA